LKYGGIFRLHTIFKTYFCCRSSFPRSNSYAFLRALTKSGINILKRTIFQSKWFPAAFVAPQLVICLVFFLWPAGQAIWESFYQSDAWSGGRIFVGLDNFFRLFADPYYRASFLTTLIFSTAVASGSLLIGFFLSLAVDRVRRGQTTYTTLLLWPYAIAPAVAGVLWSFLFHPSFGIIAGWLHYFGISWNPLLDGGDALTLTVIAAIWNQVAYNFIFFLAGLQSIPKSIVEAASIDGARPMRRLFTIIIPLLSPTLFFLMVMNIVYSFFETFGIIDAVTMGGPGQATTTLIYKAYVDGARNYDYGSSAVQSMILMAIVITLTLIQFRFIERRVHY